MRQGLLAFYDAVARDLPFRRTRDPYAIWVAEVMLQQTRVDTVLPYYERFLQRYPTVSTLAESSIDDVLTLWSGLGYYRRARLLHRGAQHVLQVHGGAVPRDVEAIAEIPGVGRYTTGAIASQAFDLEVPLVDGNVTRVLARVLGIEEDVRQSRVQEALWAAAAALVVGPRPGALNNALMELGATVCTKAAPRCLLCPLRAHCQVSGQPRAERLPVITKKAPSPQVFEVAAVVTDRAGEGETDAPRMLLGQREPGGLLGGLWEPPRLPVEGEDAHSMARGRRALQALVETVLRSETAPLQLSSEAARVVEHVFTHRRMRVTVLEGGVGSAAPVEQITDARTPAWGPYVAFAWVRRDHASARGLSTLGRKVAGWTRTHELIGRSMKTRGR